MNMNNDNSSCKKATVLMSKGMEEDLSVKEKAELTAHLAICKTCCFCFKQLKTIQKTITHYTDVIFQCPIADQHKLSEETKQRIKQKLN